MKFFLRFFVPFHNFVFRLTRGRALGQFELPVLLLTTTGRRSEKQRTIPLLYLEEGGTLLVVASMGGAPSNPGWYHNLVANPTVEVQTRAGRRCCSLLAERAAGAVKPLHGVDQQRAHPRGDVGPVEETDRVPVFVGAGASVVYLRKIGGKLGLPESTFGHVLVGANHFPPGLEGSSSRYRRLHSLQHSRCRSALLNCRGRVRFGGGEKPVADLLHRPLFVGTVDAAQHVGNHVYMGPGFFLIQVGGAGM